MVFGPQVVNEGCSLRSRLVAEAERRRVAIIDRDYTLHSSRNWRKLLRDLGALGEHLFATGDLDVPLPDGAAQPLAGWLADLAGIEKSHPFLPRRFQNRSCQRVFGVLLQS